MNDCKSNYKKNFKHGVFPPDNFRKVLHSACSLVKKKEPFLPPYKNGTLTDDFYFLKTACIEKNNNNQGPR